MKSRGTLVVVGVIAVGLAIAFAVRISEAKKKTEAAKAQVEKVVIAAVRTVAAEKKDLPQVVQITGSVKALNEVQVLPKMPGRVTRVAVDVGAVVHVGDVLATTESVDMALRVKQAEAQVQAVETEIDRLTVRAPVDGEVMQVKIHVGEFAQAGPLQTPLMVVGNVDTMNVRVDVDEHDAWRVKAGSPAEANVRGNSSLKTTLSFVRFEPYVVPKKSLTGDSTERVDTRVLQVIYSFDPKTLPIYIGQQVDVFIKGEPVSSAFSGKPAAEAPKAPAAKGV